jgi:hypothetical protein
MKQEEERLKEEIHQLLSKAEAVDEQEDKEYGATRDLFRLCLAFAPHFWECWRGIGLARIAPALVRQQG